MHNVAQLRRLRQRFPHDLVVIGVHSAKFPSEQLTENIRQAARRHGIEHTVVNDAGFQIWNEYAVRAWPTVVLIDPRGKIVHTESGEIEAEEWIPRIEALLAASPVPGAAGPQAAGLTFAEPQPATLLRYPSKLLVTPERALYVADTGHHRILELQIDHQARTARIRRTFGSGEAGLRDGPAHEAAFHHPRGMALHAGILYVADTENHSLRLIDLETGTVRTIAGTGQKGMGRYNPGPPGEIPLRSPWALLAIPGEPPEAPPILLIAMAGSHQIWVLLEGERLGVFAGSGREALVDGPPAEAGFNQPSDLAFGLGHLFVADAEASAVRAISLGPDPKVFTLVGMGLFEFGDVDGAGTEVRLQHPTGLAFAGREPAGEEAAPEGEALPGGVLYVADTYNHKLKTLDPFTGRLETLAGAAEAGSADGAFEQARFYEPEGVAVLDDLLFIADTNNHLIRIADLHSRTVHTLTLTGMEEIPLAAAQAGEEERLEAVQLAPGSGEIAFDLRLPEGYKLNPGAPITLRQPEDGTARTHTFREGEPVTLPVEARDDRELRLDLTLYYCEEEDARLCLIHDRRLVLPIHVSSGAPASARVRYTVQPGGPFIQPSA